MNNTSASGGYLLPAPSPAPLEDAALDAFLQQIVAGVTGMPGAMVRPRWQPESPNLPDFGTDWAAVGVTDQDPDTYAYIQHEPTGDGSDTLERQETITMLTSFYGPHAGGNVSLLQDGLQMGQNREVLFLNGFVLQETGRATKAPVMIKDKWTHRVDVQIIFRRQINRVYQVFNILSAKGEIDALPSDGDLIINPLNVDATTIPHPPAIPMLAQVAPLNAPEPGLLSPVQALNPVVPAPLAGTGVLAPVPVKTLIPV